MKTTVAVAASVAASFGVVAVGGAAVATSPSLAASVKEGASCLAPGLSSPTKGHPELGLVRWRRGYDAARAEAKATGKPLLVLFDEVPGCSTVRAFADAVLADDVVADAIDAEFVAVFVSNNDSVSDGGADRRVLERFAEPAWNNPVVRIMDPDEHPLVPRIEGALLLRAVDGGATPAALMATSLQAALLAAKRPVPPWLQAKADDALGVGADRDVATATYAMGCFWEGEVQLGAIDGVASTTPGFVDGREVVRLRYDPKRVGRRVIDDLARAKGYVAATGAFRAAPEDDKKQIQRNALGRLPMSQAQRMHVNSAVGRGEDPGLWLSPRQLQRLQDTACDGGR